MTVTPTLTPIPAVRVVIGSVDAFAGQEVDVDVRLETLGDVTSVSTFFDFDENAPVIADDQGQPRCVVAEGIVADDFMFGYLPVGCTAGDDCTGVEAAILDTVQPIADQSVVYTCTVRVADDATPGLVDIPCISASVMGPPDFDIDATCVSGSVVVNETVEPTTPASPTETPTIGGSTPIPTSTAANTPTRRRIDEDDGCQTTRPSNTTTAWLLLLPAALLLRRRRTRG